VPERTAAITNNTANLFIVNPVKSEFTRGRRF
jgi:hypothetical protein